MKKMLSIVLIILASFSFSDSVFAFGDFAEIPSAYNLPYTRDGITYDVLYQVKYGDTAGDNYAMYCKSEDGAPIAYGLSSGYRIYIKYNSGTSHCKGVQVSNMGNYYAWYNAGSYAALDTSAWGNILADFRSTVDVFFDNALSTPTTNPFAFGGLFGLYDVYTGYNIYPAAAFGGGGPTSYSFPLSGSLENRTILLEFGDDWTFGECPTNVYKKHAGLDLSATADESVYAAHSGTVKAIYTGQQSQWADAIIIEDDNEEFTTVYWHVNPYGGLSVNDNVTKGQQIATVADLGGNTHFHFGIRMSGYDANFALAGALPVESCGTSPTYPAFPESFIDPSALTYE
jgi:murein DD-endopeptidase MepM/ murein hydrolase activator NlpD